MTYFGFLLRFLVIPILILLFINRWDGQYSANIPDRMKVLLGILIHVILAVVYTTPWDNYLVATGVWYYKPQLVSGYLWGYVPVEEYAFFVLETILVGLWWRFLAGRLSQPGEFKPSKNFRFTASLLLVMVWGIFAVLFLSKVSSFLYLSIIMVWALPAILPQFIFGADILWHHRKLVVLTILPVSIYLSLVDAIAISGGTWTIDPARSTGIKFGALPVEEALFFLMTNLLLGFGLTLLIVKESPLRLSDLRHTMGSALMDLFKRSSKFFLPTYPGRFE